MISRKNSISSNWSSKHERPRNPNFREYLKFKDIFATPAFFQRQPAPLTILLFIEFLWKFKLKLANNLLTSNYSLWFLSVSQPTTCLQEGSLASRLKHSFKGLYDFFRIEAVPTLFTLLSFIWSENTLASAILQFLVLESPQTSQLPAQTKKKISLEIETA